MLERFLLETLPALDYLELSSLQMTDDLISKCSEKFRQLVIFGSPDLPHNKRQHLLPHYTIVVTMIFAKDFPLNIKPPEVTKCDEKISLGQKSLDQSKSR